MLAGCGVAQCRDLEASSGDDDSSSTLSVNNISLPEPSLVRLRFFNFNMANIAALDPFTGMFGEFLAKPFADGAPVDIAFVALTEARFKMRGFVQQQLDRWKHRLPLSGLDALVHRDALRKRPVRNYNIFSKCRKKVVQHCVGNVKTVLGFSQGRFVKEERDEQLQGAFTLNPEKAFIGTSIVRKQDGLRLCFFGTHFPMQKLQAVLLSKNDENDRLMAAKIEYARVLREVLCQVSSWELGNDQTVVFVQGDLNSRTVFDFHEIGSQAKDVLLEVLSDAALMAAIAHDLPLPPGRWREVVHFNGVNEMPVTYKVDPRMRIGNVVTVGDILNRIHDPAQPPPQPRNPSRQLTSVARKEFSQGWGLKNDPAKVKPSHFPAFTERVIYWAPDSLTCHLSWALPHGGYEILGHVDGSDHRPVTLEATMEIGPAAQPDGPPLPHAEDPAVKELAARLEHRRFFDWLFCSTESPQPVGAPEAEDSDSDVNAW
eukprot:gb/GFBE01051985.1/.p1 GENE.gb/GFBE01051985.1/~~gb/GFBE01051985.1/.p1  ORF type:complete len:486 (+),score=99.75 gb/GFBE01051985.1/:1-1458(+)